MYSTTKHSFDFDNLTIEKRDDSIVKFNFNKIEIAIQKAVDAVNKIDNIISKSDIDKLLLSIKIKIMGLISDKNNAFNIEFIQDLIIKTMKENKFNFLAYMYSNYRESQLQKRNNFEDRVTKIISNYINKDTWEIKENSNMQYSVQGLNIHLFSKFNKTYWKKEVFKEQLFKYHESGDLHIHDLYLLAPYCVGWDLKDLLLNGFSGVSAKVSCSPPKHFDSACGQLVNFLYTMQGEAAGAVAFSNVDTYLAPFIEKDNLHKNPNLLNQYMQKMIYNLNVPTRVGFQCLSYDTEILKTDNTWISYNDLHIDDNIYVFNRENKCIETDIVTGVNIYKYKGVMCNFISNHMDQLVTPNHNTIIKDQLTGKFYFKHASEILSQAKTFISGIITDTSTNIIQWEEEDITTLAYVNDYDNVVWCPTTETGTVIARRNGKMFITGNSPFTNFSLDLECPNHMKDEPIVIDGKYSKDKTYGQFQTGMDAFNKTFCKIMGEGDKNNKIFSFPIPTYCIDKEFNWDKEEYKPIWEMTAKFGIPYFSNYINSDMSKEDTRSLCCRLRLNLNELRKRGGGLFGANSLTGSIGVVTINLPRIGYLAKDKKEFFDRIKHQIDIASNILIKKIEFVEIMTEKNFYPYSKFFLRNVKEQHNRYWANHFLTIGIIGMHEACINFFKDQQGIESREGYNLTIEMMNMINSYLIKLQNKTGHLYNLEASPAESTGLELFNKDKIKYPDMFCFKNNEALEYTNSTNLPVDTDKHIYAAIKHQNEIQALYTGGTVFHSMLKQSINSNIAKNLIKKVLTENKLPYFSLTPTFSICEIHGFIPGNVEYCQVCGKKTQIFSRIVGYYRDISNWNIGKKNEFEMRTTYKL